MKNENAPATKADIQSLIDHINNQSREVKTYVHEEIERVDIKVDALQKGVSNLKRDMTEVKSDLSQLKTDMTEVKEDVSTIASELEIEIGKNKKTA